MQAAAVSDRRDLVELLLDQETHFGPQEKALFSTTLRQANNLGLDDIAKSLRERGVSLPEDALKNVGSLARDVYLEWLPQATL